MEKTKWTELVEFVPKRNKETHSYLILCFLPQRASKGSTQLNALLFSWLCVSGDLWNCTVCIDGNELLFFVIWPLIFTGVKIENAIGDDGATVVAEALRSNYSVTLLNLESDYNRKKRCESSVMITSFQQGTTLESQEQSHSARRSWQTIGFLNSTWEVSRRQLSHTDDDTSFQIYTKTTTLVIPARLPWVKH